MLFKSAKTDFFLNRRGVSPTNFVSHNFDVKLRHYFGLIKVKYRLAPNTQIIQQTISKHHSLCEYRETSTVEYISLQTVFLI